ncbi:MFS transporter [Streptomyces sp. NPDC014806]|uniref:MFS transporter n=1 Tax=Streptomyces sp. NPDC014806 TaxID=3364920 RepID=UPI0036FC1E4C
MLDMNIVTVALADIAGGLHVSAATAQWAVLGYQLPVVALLLPAGRWLDGVGMRPAVLGAVAGFALCGALAAAAPWAAWLIAARLAQGACGAVLFVLMPVLASRAVRPERRGRAMSVPATLGPLGAVTGPAVGGLLLDHVGWPAVFLVKLPLCAAALWVTWRVMPGEGERGRDRRREVFAAGPAGPAAGVRRAVADLGPAAGVRRAVADVGRAAGGRAVADLGSAAGGRAVADLGSAAGGRAVADVRSAAGGRAVADVGPAAGGRGVADVGRAAGRHAVADVGLVAAGIAALLLALTLAADRPAWLLLALVAVPPLAWWLRGPGGRPVTGVLRVPGSARAHGAVLALATGFAAAHYVVALHLRRDVGADATVTGLTVLAFPLGMTLAGPLAGRLADRYGARPVAATGAALTALGLLLVALLPPDHWSPGQVAWRLALAGAGMGLNGGPVQALVLGTAPPERVATAGSTVQLARSLGFTFGPALATAAWTLTGPRTGVHTALALAAGAACLAVPLLARGARCPRRGADERDEAAVREERPVRQEAAVPEKPAVFEEPAVPESPAVPEKPADPPHRP